MWVGFSPTGIATALMCLATTYWGGDVVGKKVDSKINHLADYTARLRE